MRILSLNVNGFGGNIYFLEGEDGIKKTYGYPSWISKWSEIQLLYDTDGLYNFLVAVDADIIFFQEYYANSAVTKAFTKKLENLNYHMTRVTPSIKLPSMTVMFSKEEYVLENSPHINTKKTLRSVQVKTPKASLIGTHVPYCSAFWDELIKYYKNTCKSHAVVMIGDFNIWLEKVDNDLTKYEALLEVGAIDLGKVLNKPTRANKRIDFAFVSKELESLSRLYTTPCDIDGKCFNSLVSKNLSDHEALILDIL